jgi:hypothetical protein
VIEAFLNPVYASTQHVDKSFWVAMVIFGIVGLAILIAFEVCRKRCQDCDHFVPDICGLGSGLCFRKIAKYTTCVNCRDGACKKFTPADQVKKGFNTI